MATARRKGVVLDAHTHKPAARHTHHNHKKHTHRKHTHSKHHTNNEQAYEAVRKRVLKQRGKALKEHRAHTAKPHKKGLPWKKLALLILAIIAFMIIWNTFDIPGLILQLLQMNPHVWSTYQYLQAEIAERSLTGLLYASIFSTLVLSNPIMPIPPEVIFVYYLGLNYYVVQIITIMLVGNLLAMAANWFIGWLIGERAVKFFMRKSYPKFRKKLERAGGFLVLFGNIIPFPMEIFAVFLGAVNYKFWRFMLFTAIGRTVKFALLAIGYNYFLKYAAPYLSTLSVDWFIETVRQVFVFW